MTSAWIHPSDVWLSETQSLSNAQLVANHFIATGGWVKESISALCGNARHESSINPDIWEYGYNHSLDRGYGLLQWTPASKYINWATASGLPWDDGDSQLSRIDYEATNGIQWIANGYQLRYRNSTPKYDFSFADFRSNAPALSVADLAEAFMWNYEGPSFSAGLTSLSGRQSFAQTCYDNLDWTGVATVIPPSDGGYGGGGTTPLKNHNTLIALLLSDALHGWK